MLSPLKEKDKFQALEQAKTGISRRFEEFVCKANTTTNILGGNLQITSKRFPVTVKARMCLFEDFETVSETIARDNEVTFGTDHSSNMGVIVKCLEHLFSDHYRACDGN